MTARHAIGRRRARIAFGVLGGVASAGAMALVLIFYGQPYDPVWWWVMGGILIAAVVVPVGLVPVFDWVMDGYLKGPERH